MIRILLVPSIVLLLLSVSCSAAPIKVPSADPARLMALLETQCAYGPRYPGSEGHKQIHEFLRTSLEGPEISVVRQPFTIVGYDQDTLEMANWVASFKPASSTRILICSHFDTRPRADSDPSPAKRGMPIIGANDAGSGTAILLYLAEVMRKNPPPVGVDLVFFDGEDYGREGDLQMYCLGSQYFAKQNANYRPSLGILLDMVGKKDLTLYKERNSMQFAPDMVERVFSMAKKLGVGEFKDSAKHTVYDDHIPLNQAGIRCIDLIDFDYPAWHTLGDTPDKCSGQSLAQVTKVLLDLIYRSKEKK